MRDGKVVVPYVHSGFAWTHQEPKDHKRPGGMSVSQSSSSVMFDGSGQLDGERMVDQSGKSDVTI